MRKKANRPIVRVDADLRNGLTAAQVAERNANGYANRVTDKTEKSFFRILAGNTFTFFNAILFLIAAVFLFFIFYLKAIGQDEIVSQYFGISKFVFLIPAVMNVTMGTIQEVHSMKVIRNLRIVTETRGRVVRDGEVRTVDASEIVLDDVVLLSAGDQATADLLVAEGELYVDESMLTGESDHVRKGPGDTVLSGSAVIVGEGRCRACAVGNATYAAKLTSKVKGGARHKSELMTSIMKIMKVLTAGLVLVVITIVITLAVKIAGTGSDPSIWNGLTLSLDDSVSWGLIALTGGSFGVGLIPSGLVLTTSVALMVSIAQLTKKQTLIQELYSLENLSRIDVICLDKTGTLTDGTMSVVDMRAYVPMEQVTSYAKDLMHAAGDRNATSEAVYQKFGIAETENYQEKIPFSSAVKYSGLVYPDGKKLLMGAPEYLLNETDERLSFASECASDGKRVLAMTLDGELQAFIVIEDHIRDTAPDTLRFFRENGVTVKVISGDNPLTVSKIAANCGIRHADRYMSLAGVPLEQIPEIAEDYTVFARVSPEQKEALVTALQKKGHKVAMTGDGVNDILALRKSDSSITFAKATEAAKSCSDVVLLDNDFSHLKDVVGEGRRVIGNIQKTAILYLMKSIAVFLCAFALIPLAKGQLWFSIENMYMLEAAVIGTGGFLLSLEPQRRPLKGSFMKMIGLQSAAAGILAAFAVLVPILFNMIPKALGYAPLVTDINVRPMMTVLMSVSGFVVIFAMCLPFNRYRTFAMGALLLTAAALGFLLPSSFVGGETMGEGMMAFDAAAGQTFFDTPFMQELLRPWNAEVVKNLTGDYNNFAVLRLFLFAAIPLFVLVLFGLENYVRKDDGKDVRTGRAFRIGRRMMLASGLVLFLRALLALAELVFADRKLIPVELDVTDTGAWIINLCFFIAFMVIGVFGYKLWKDPTKKIIKAALPAALLLAGLTVAERILQRRIWTGTDLLSGMDGAIAVGLTLVYLIGAVLVRANISRGLEKKRGLEQDD
ncbi:MAG: HAD-IC family P-type ATPase [Clostridia bacterium]|nr:HAD-IC family P-type ATPase [Clostridia bacterium]